MQTHLDLYSFNQGRQFALEMFGSSRMTLNDRFVIVSIIGNLEKSLQNKPPSFAMGAKEIIDIAKNVI